jgi:hypothetical protein
MNPISMRKRKKENKITDKQQRKLNQDIQREESARRYVRILAWCTGALMGGRRLGGVGLNMELEREDDEDGGSVATGCGRRL